VKNWSIKWAIQGDKVSMSWFKNYLAVVSRAPKVDSSQNMEDSMASDSLDHGDGPGTVLTIYDLKNKYVAFTGTFGGELDLSQVVTGKGGIERKPAAIKFVVSEWGQLFVITADKKVMQSGQLSFDLD
jgi:hypothetical protein